jgi:hypothetical protein
MTRQASRSTSIETLRGGAYREVDLLLQAAAALRAQLRNFETALRHLRGHLGRAAATSEMHDVLDFSAVRETLSHATDDFEAARHATRISIFRLQAAQGMSVGAIAREWGLSRQLVSRMLKEAQPKGSSAS